MFSTTKDRSTRREDIQKGLQFIESALSYPGNEEQYEAFLQDLVRDLFCEGNDVYSERDWVEALGYYNEALNIVDYAESEGIRISAVVTEKLYANRAACYLNMEKHDKVLEDCDNALKLNGNNYRAQYRKSKSLKELEKYKEAYDIILKCALAVPQDENVVKLTQELAKKLGLKIRKAYVRAQPALTPIPTSVSCATRITSSGVTGSVEDIESDLLEHGSESVSASSVTSMSGNDIFTSGNQFSPISVPSPASPVSQQMDKLSTPSVLANGSTVSLPLPKSHLHGVDEDIIGDELDELLDSEGDASKITPLGSNRGPIPNDFPSSVPPGIPLNIMGPLEVTTPLIPTVPLPLLYSFPLPATFPTLDSLDSFSVIEPKRDSHSLIGGPFGSSLSYSTELNSTSSLFRHDRGQNERNILEAAEVDELGIRTISAASVSNSHPLFDTHEFRQACSLCFKSGDKVLHFEYQPNLEHKCKKDILIGRLKNSEGKQWKLIRPRPTKTQYVGPYYICKDVAAGEECRYPGRCTFAYCQEEIDVWTLERKGAFSRELLFDPFGGSSKTNLTVCKLLQEHNGIFMFLCEVCFNHKPRIISKRNKESPFCSHPIRKHDFEENKCLVHILQETSVKYSKIRPLSDHSQFDLCRHEVRYGCIREDDCFYAHSLIELKVWMMESNTGISHEEITQESKKYWQTLEAKMPGNHLKFGLPTRKLKFVCGQCWKNGQTNEADKKKQYCIAKARHPWTKDRRVVIVMSDERKKWTAVRPPPARKPLPLQFDLCNHVTSGNKCRRNENCSFAHSAEEKEMWTYMKEKHIHDMEQLYDLWLKSQKPGVEETCGQASKEGEKSIHMPTDYADFTFDFHCWLCGKNCNSEKQWQQHLASEKHKEKVFLSEDDKNCWQYRFPTGYFNVCERHISGTCSDGDSCQLAHSHAELEEWLERKDILRMKLDKAKKDHLIAPNDNDFGKYNFLSEGILS
ncbi:zinc finger CCCH domain-containing protein 7A [Protopterus annectens]|uniref:zinc finger CCCH domain-containing protein 7A n=1 Tax=Protopterus annectens TaxID=7888 RepID=UPI001CFAB36E|nr:zinc finger CCCH domain-containing protein 7A [Protopterus annectens]